MICGSKFQVGHIDDPVDSDVDEVILTGDLKPRTYLVANNTLYLGPEAFYSIWESTLPASQYFESVIKSKIPSWAFLVVNNDLFLGDEAFKYLMAPDFTGRWTDALDRYRLTFHMFQNITEILKKNEKGWGFTVSGDTVFMEGTLYNSFLTDQSLKGTGINTLIQDYLRLHDKLIYMSLNTDLEDNDFLFSEFYVGFGAKIYFYVMRMYFFGTRTLLHDNLNDYLTSIYSSVEAFDEAWTVFIKDDVLYLGESVYAFLDKMYKSIISKD